MHDDVVFIGMDFVNTIKSIVESAENDICGNMSENEYNGYKFGVHTVISLLDCVVNEEPSNMFVHVNGLDGQEEFLFEDLKKLFNK